MKLPVRLLPFGCAGAVLSFALPAAPPLWLMPVAAVGCALLCYGLRHTRQAWLLAATAALLAGGAYALWRTDAALAHRLNAADTGQVHALTIRVADLPQQGELAVRFPAQILAADLPLNTVLLSDYHGREWPLGSVWHVAARLNTPVGTVNPAGFNREAWALGNGIDAVGSLRKTRTAVPSDHTTGTLTRIRAAALERIRRVGAKQPQGTALVAALSLGVRSDLSDDDWQAFRRLGMTHLVSISGLHVGMAALFAALAAAALLRLWARCPRLPVPQNPKTVYALVGLAAALCYALLAGFSVPTQRSVVMIAVAAYAMCSRRFFTLWQLWWVALAAVLLFDPLSVLSIGLWLSFGLVAALIFSGGNIVRPHRVTKLRLFGEAQYAATLASIVPLGIFFAALPLVSPLANAVGIPWFSALLTPLTLLALLCPWDGLLQLVLWLAAHTLEAMTAVANFAPMLPVSRAPWWWAMLALPATAVWLLPRGLGLRLWAGIVLAGFIFFPAPIPPPGNVRATAYDVGQGSALLVQTRHHALLFDTGKRGANLSLTPSLYADGVRRLDALVLSHHDNDHDGAAAEIRTALPVTRVWAGDPAAYPFPAQHCTDGLRWQWDGVLFEFLTPTSAAVTAGGDNDKSCVLRVLAGGHALMVTGDLSAAGEAALVHRYGDRLYSQILLLGHHGSRTSSSPPFLNRVQPRYALASAGFGNSFSHPHPLVTGRLAARDITLLRTDLNGAIRFEWGREVRAHPATGYRPYWQQKPFDSTERKH